jgi:hypothetical protein
MAKIIIKKKELEIKPKGSELFITSGVTINNLRVDVNYTITSKNKWIEIIAIGNGNEYRFGPTQLSNINHNYFMADISKINSIWKVEKILVRDIAGKKSVISIEVVSLFKKSVSNHIKKYVSIINTVKLLSAEKWSIGYIEGGSTPSNKNAGLYFSVDSTQTVSKIFEHFIDAGLAEIPFVGVFEHARHIRISS